jgi:hypothetical protein
METGYGIWNKSLNAWRNESSLLEIEHLLNGDSMDTDLSETLTASGAWGTGTITIEGDMDTQSGSGGGGWGGGEGGAGGAGGEGGEGGEGGGDGGSGGEGGNGGDEGEGALAAGGRLLSLPPRSSAVTATATATNTATATTSATSTSTSTSTSAGTSFCTNTTRHH